MTVTAPQNRRAWLLFTARSSIVSAVLLSGCNHRKTEPAPPAVSNSSAPAARQPVTPVPAVKKHLYPADADAKADIAAALKQARSQHKRVILDFGGDWCGDCQVLDIYFHQQPNSELLDKNFLVVHIDVGHFDKNVDVAEQYRIPLKKGVPALAVLDAEGKLLYSQQTGEFEEMRYMQGAAVTGFLNRWKA